ncbi:unnamed protein product [Lasius platythorax]|uniref:Uncharacterized protein n=1 Tax=Lasius platythorax TaxID=488582 RepID=A0AAV2N2W5_9HYME
MRRQRAAGRLKKMRRRNGRVNGEARSRGRKQKEHIKTELARGGKGWRLTRNSGNLKPLSGILWMGSPSPPTIPDAPGSPARQNANLRAPR